MICIKINAVFPEHSICQNEKTNDLNIKHIFDTELYTFMVTMWYFRNTDSSPVISDLRKS